MDDLDRLFQRLVHNIRFRSPEYLTVPFTVQELYETLVPYRHHRRELGIETNQDYETAVARLLSGERDYVHTDPALEDKLKKELASVNPDPGVFRDDASTRVSLDPVALEKFGVQQPATAPAAAPSSPASSADATAPIPSFRNVEVPVGCRFCGGTLPEGRRVTYCPHCGMNLATRRCEGCGTELEQGWHYCVNCGKKVG
jgi:hypothetical protein